MNCYGWLAANNKKLDLYIFDSLSKVVLARAAKVARNLLEVEIAVPEGVPSRTARLEFLVQLVVARAANARPARPAY